MSVYKPSKSRYFHYDFVHKGRRVHGSTGCETRRRAESVERKVRQDLIDGRLDEAAQLTLADAAERWWQERGRRLKTAAQTHKRLMQMVRIVGGERRLVEITTSVVAAAMERRQSVGWSRGANCFAISNRTTNLDIIDTLRPVLRRAERVWEARGLPVINWGAVRLPESKPKPKEFTEAELAALVGALPPHWTDFIEFAARYGARLGEMFFGLHALDVDDLEDARVVLQERKNDDDHIIPLLPEDAARLAERKQRAQAAGLNSVWFRELKNGRLKSLTYHAAESAIRNGLVETGLRAAKGLKGSHDLRRSAAMKILRATGNLRLAQRLLGHASIHSTLRYAHALEADVKAGLVAVARQKSAATTVRAKSAPSSLVA